MFVQSRHEGNPEIKRCLASELDGKKNILHAFVPCLCVRVWCVYDTQTWPSHPKYFVRPSVCVCDVSVCARLRGSASVCVCPCLCLCLRVLRFAFVSVAVCVCVCLCLCLLSVSVCWGLRSYNVSCDASEHAAARHPTGRLQLQRRHAGQRRGGQLGRGTRGVLPATIPPSMLFLKPY